MPSLDFRNAYTQHSTPFKVHRVISDTALCQMSPAPSWHHSTSGGTALLLQLSLGFSLLSSGHCPDPTHIFTIKLRILKCFPIHGISILLAMFYLKVHGYIAFLEAMKIVILGLTHAYFFP